MKANQYAAKCADCGQWVPADAGIRRRGEDGAWEVSHRGACPEPGEAPAREPEAPLWAVVREGRTPLGNRATGLALVAGARPAGESFPANETAAAILARQEAERPEPYPSEGDRATHRAWLAFARLEHLLPMGDATMETLDADFGAADVAEIRARHGAALAQLRERCR